MDATATPQDRARVYGTLSQANIRRSACACAIDRIAAALGFDDYVEVTTFINNANMSGEGGGMSAAKADAPDLSPKRR